MNKTRLTVYIKKHGLQYKNMAYGKNEMEHTVIVYEINFIILSK